MPFTAPMRSLTGRFIDPDKPKEPLAPGGHCLICGEVDPAKYVNCTSPDCSPVYFDGPPGFGPGYTVPVPAPPSTFSRPARLVSAYELAARMRRKADSLPWENDNERGQLLSRARELTSGDYDEVPDEDV